jgi:hypothetical protein
MAKRVAFVMKLREGVTRAEIRELLALLDRVADPEWVKHTRTKYEDRGVPHVRDGKEYMYTPVEVPDDRERRIFQKYNDEYGDPCFYIP